MKILVANLSIVQLDYAAALVEGFKFGAPKRLPNVHVYSFPLSRPDWDTLGTAVLMSDGWYNVPRFSTGPAGDLIIDREHITTQWLGEGEGWAASLEAQDRSLRGAARREAAMRAWVAHNLGPEIEIHEVIK